MTAYGEQFPANLSSRTTQKISIFSAKTPKLNGRLLMIFPTCPTCGKEIARQAKLVGLFQPTNLSYSSLCPRIKDSNIIDNFIVATPTTLSPPP